MWLIPVLGAIVVLVAAASKSPREAAPPSRQLPAPAASGVPLKTSRLPGPISVLGEILKIGQYPPPQVILCAIAEAESLGRRDLASDIVSAFVAPVVYRHQLAKARSSQLMPVPPSNPVPYERGSCALVRSPRAQADASSCAPIAARAACTPIAARAPRAPDAPAAPAPAAVPQVADRSPTQDEILSMLHSDPDAFLSMVASQQSRRGPAVEIFPVGTRPPILTSDQPDPSASMPPAPVMAPPAAAPPLTVNSDALADQLIQIPGAAGAGILLVDPSTGEEVFEVRWLRGYQVPPLPQTIDGRPVRIVVVDNLPAAQPTGLPPEAVAQMQEAASLHTSPGSPLGGVPDSAWREFVSRLEREAPTFSSSRHVGQYRQRRERVAELGIDPRAIHSPAAQRAALDADLADAHQRLVETGDLQTHVGRRIAVPGTDEAQIATLSGILGVVQCAGLDGAIGWLERSNDRKRYPHTTQAFLRTNGVF